MKICSAHMKEILSDVAAAIDREKVLLSDLDSHIGDGDHGVGMANGFRIGVQELSSVETGSIDEFLRTIGNALIRDVGGVSGIIFGSVFLGMARQASGKVEVGTAELSEMLAAGLELAQKRGKALPGDKTMIDALHPAVETLKANSDSSLSDALASAAAAARIGAEKTKDFIGKHGRAKYFREKSIGFQDAGATSVAVIVEAMAESVKRLEANSLANQS